MEQQHSESDGQEAKRTIPRNPLLRSPWLILIALAALGVYFLGMTTGKSKITYSFFLEQLDAGNVAELDFVNSYEIQGKFKTPPDDPEGKKGADNKPKQLLKEFSVVRLPVENDPELMRRIDAKNIIVRADRPSEDTGSMLMTVVMLATVALMAYMLWITYQRTRDQFMGGGIFGNFTKSPARRYEADKQKVTFADVAGMEGVKRDLEELVEFLKNPVKYQRLGGRVPKGTLLMGPPGTGKTLLAKAVAGEAEAPFYAINGSEFIQMFVGVGASRVRDLFRTAKQNAPCIVFIDEIDAVGRVRGAGFGGGHDEREQTLNQILSEMDGFTPTESVLVIAATNRPDVLDPALLRPGRFDRHITVDRPTVKGRAAIFRVHTRKVPLGENVDIERLAAGTVGLTGADIRNLVNEAALWATRNGKDKVEMSDFEHARDRVLMGPKREEVLSPKEKEMTAYHEAGHALLAWLLPGVDRVHKVTVVPRGRALGVTQLLPEEDRMSIAEDDLHSRLTFILGGRAAEKLVFGQFTAGAENDLQKGTQIARRMVAHWGMSERLGPVAFRTGEEHPFLGKEFTEQRDFSEHTARLIDEEVTRLMHTADERARSMLAEHRDKLDKLAAALVSKEEVEEAEIEKLIGPSANRKARQAAEAHSHEGNGSLEGSERRPATTT